MNKTFTISINKTAPLYPKEEAHNKVLDGWEQFTQEWSENKLLETIKTLGISPAIYKNGKKIQKNVLEFYSIMLDIDDGVPTLNEFINIVKTWKYPAFIVTSTSHKIYKKGKLAERYRCWIPFSKKINVEQFLRLSEYFEKMFPIDHTIVSYERYYYPCPAQEHYFHNPDTEFLDPFTLIEEVLPIKDNKKSILKDTFSENDYVRLSNNKVVQIKDIPKDSSHSIDIYCPFCDLSKRNGNNANADLNISKWGEYNIHCYSASRTYYQNPEELDMKIYPVFNLLNTRRTHGMERGIFTEYENPNFWLSFCIQNELNPKIKPYLVRAKATYDPLKLSGIIPADTKNSKEYDFNLYEKAELLSRAEKSKITQEEATLSWVEQHCPYAYRVLTNLLGTEEYMNHFLNWLAVALTRRNTPIWLFVTKTGAGKGLIMNHLFKHVFKQAAIIKANVLKGQFNTAYAYKQLVAIDEIFSRGYEANFEILQEIKTFSNPTINIEGKGKDQIEIPNYMNLLLFTNYLTSVKIDEGDTRRFIVIRNPNGITLDDTVSWWPKEGTIEGILKEESYDFARYLVSRQKSIDLANTVLDTQDKRMIQMVGEDTYDSISKWFEKEDWDAFRFDEIYGAKFSEYKPDEVLSDCLKFNGIPSYAWKDIVTYYFRFKTVNDINKALYTRGIRGPEKRTRDGIQKRVYFHGNNKNNQPQHQESDLFI